MAHVRPRKRPCSICRKWFMPDKRQAGRQKTCSAECRRELHRRNCAEWNNRNAVYFKSNYLDKKLQRDCRPPPDSPQPEGKADSKPVPPARINLKLPRDIIEDKIGTDTMIITEYVTEQIFARIRNHPARFG